MEATTRPLTIERGTLLLYHCFDVGEEILVDGIERVFGEAPTSSRLVYERLTPAYVQYRKAPLLVDMGPVTLESLGRSWQAACRAKLYDFGVITIVFKVPFEGLLGELGSTAAALVGSIPVREAAQSQVARMKEEVARAIVRAPHEEGEPTEDEWEDYAVFWVEGFDRQVRGAEILATHSRDLARVLRNETKPLSDATLAEAVRHALSYYEDELAVIDWNAALVYDPRQSYDVPDVLEYAVAMLLELRAYDALLDRALDRAYDDLEVKRSFFRLTPYASTIDYLSEVKLDVSKVVEKVTNTLKLVGDPYLARVYSSASMSFHLPTWERSVREKLTSLESLYSMLHDRTQTRQLLILELMIVFLFILDIIVLVH